MKHGLKKHPLYSIWVSMKQRCYNPNDTAYDNYGGRGVRVCAEWVDDFQLFYNWAIANGWEHGLQIDKDIKGNGLLYSPDTCCFVTPKVNSNTKRNCHIITLDGVSKNITQWSEHYGISEKQIHWRLKKGWTIQNALTKPVRKKPKRLRQSIRKQKRTNALKRKRVKNLL